MSFFSANLELPAVRWIVLTGFFLVGASLGSFLNVCFWRIPRGESVVTTPSHCTSCQHKIAWYDNLPIFSFLILRGKCRYCRAPYSARYFAVELACGTLFAAFAATGILVHWTPVELLIPGCAALYFAFAIAWFDFFYRVIPGGVTQVGFLAGIVLAGIFPRTQGTNFWLEALLYSAASGAGFWIALALFANVGKRFAKREVLGGGDVKAMAAIAAMLGWKGGFFILLAASLIGAGAGLFKALVKKKRIRTQSVAFGVALALAIALWCFARMRIVAIPFFAALR